MTTVYYNSPVGTLELISDGQALTGLGFVNKRAATGKAKITCPVLKRTIQQLDEYFSKKRQRFDLPLTLDGTDFQKRVWQGLTKIPFGKTCSYGDIAKLIRKPLACRAVGGANNKNPIAIIIPCHRVIGMNGKLVGYGGGLEKKAWLLKHEDFLS